MFFQLLNNSHSYRTQTTCCKSQIPDFISVAVRTRNPSLGQQTSILQLLHPLPAELPAQGVVNPSSPAEPHQPRPPQRGAERVERRGPFVSIRSGRHGLLTQLSSHEGVNCHPYTLYLVATSASGSCGISRLEQPPDLILFEL